MKDDLVDGIKAIAAHLGFTEAKTYALHRGGHIPTFVVGRSVFARKSQLDRKFRGPEN